jgi:acyl-CoA reductase-like NAD-dependent aldehyde dehydrogenase
VDEGRRQKISAPEKRSSQASFGGVGNSGTGAYDGKAGFDRLTRMRAAL